MTPSDLPPAAELAERALLGARSFPTCARFTGVVTQVDSLGPIRTASTFDWQGELRGEHWTRWEWHTRETSNQAVQLSFDEWPFLPSFFGAVPGVGERDGTFGVTNRLLEELLGMVGTAVELETVDLDGEQLRYRRDLSARRTLFGLRENTVQVWFDPDLRPRRWEVVLEHPVAMEDGKIRRLTLTLEADTEGWPLSDALDTTLGYGLLTLRMQRTIGFERLGCEDVGG